MYAWAALKPADIVQAAQALRDLFRGEKPDDEAQSARPVEAPRPEEMLAGDSAPAE